jgi:hypothetical protein
MFAERDWFGALAAPAASLDELRRATPVALPESYYELLAFSDGGEGPLPVNPFNLCLDASKQVIEAIRTRNFERPELDGFIIFGGSGGGEYLAFDTRTESPWPIVTIDMVAGPASAEQIAADFDTFLDLIGREGD